MDIKVSEMKFLTWVKKNHMQGTVQGTVSQSLYLGFSFNVM